MNPPQDKIEIDESKIVKGQMKYILKLMEMVKEKDKQEIADILTNWFRDENTCGGTNCCIKECDLCINCFQNLCNRFGCVWNKDNQGDKVFLK